MSQKHAELEEINAKIGNLREAINDYQYKYGFEEDFDDAYNLLGRTLTAGIRLANEELVDNEEVWVVSFIATDRHPSFSAGHVSHGTYRNNRKEAEERLERVRTTWDSEEDTPIWVPFIERIG